jgi:hypothetical protein
MERGARQLHKRLFYCINVNRSSLDHLLLGVNADVDKNVEWSEYNAGLGICQEQRFLEFGPANSDYRSPRLSGIIAGGSESHGHSH